MMSHPTGLAAEVLSLTGKADRTTDRARDVVDLAIGVASQCSSRSLDSKHMLSGMVREGSGVAAHMLKAHGLQPARLDRLLVGDAPAASGFVDGSLSIDDDLKAALGNSWEIAQSMQHNFIGTEHLLLAILSQENRARELLRHLGIDWERVALETRGLIQRSKMAQP